MKPYYTLYCCNCTEKGHESSSCDKLRWSKHFPNPIYVTKYEPQPKNPSSNSEAKDFVIQDVMDGVILLFEGIDLFDDSLNQKTLHVRKDILKDLISQEKLLSCMITRDFQEFLSHLVADSAARIELKKIDGIVTLNLTYRGGKAFYTLILAVLKQYFNRENNEKKYLLYHYDRSKQGVADLYSLIKQELAKSNECPLYLYQKIVNLESCRTRNEIEEEELLNCTKKLLIALYKFGSIKVYGCKKICAKIEKFLRQDADLFNFRHYLQLVHLYNFVFVPRSIKNLLGHIENYKKSLLKKYKKQELDEFLNLWCEKKHVVEDALVFCCQKDEELKLSSEEDDVRNNNFPRFHRNAWGRSGNRGKNTRFWQHDNVRHVQARQNFYNSRNQSQIYNQPAGYQFPARGSPFRQKPARVFQNRGNFFPRNSRYQVPDFQDSLLRFKIICRLSDADKSLRHVKDMRGREIFVRKMLDHAKQLKSLRLKKQVGILNRKLVQDEIITGSEVLELLIDMKYEELVKFNQS